MEQKVKFNKIDKNYVSEDGRFVITYYSGDRVLYDNQAVDRAKCKRIIGDLKDGTALAQDIVDGKVILSPKADATDYLIRLVETEQLSTRAYTILRHAGIDTLEEISKYWTANRLRKCRNCGDITLAEIKGCLNKFGLDFAEQDVFFTPPDSMDMNQNVENKEEDLFDDEWLQDGSMPSEAALGILNDCKGMLGVVQRLVETQNVEVLNMFEKLRAEFAECKFTTSDDRNDGCQVSVIEYDKAIALINKKLDYLIEHTLQGEDQKGRI